MLRGLLIVRVKAAEQALRDGRIDDAFRMAIEPEIAGQSRGSRLLAGLGKAFVQRAREHYRAERFTEALLDLGKAEQCGGVKKEVAELRDQVTTVAREVARQDADRRRRLEEARMRIYGGSIAAGKELLEKAEQDDTQVQGLRNELANREKRSTDLLARAESAIRKNDIDVAVDALIELNSLDAHCEKAHVLEEQLCDRLVKLARQAFDSGSLSRAESELGRLKSLSEHNSSRQELAEWLSIADRAGSAMAAGEYDEAQNHMHRLKSLCPKTSWVNKAVDQLARLDAALLGLKSSPIGEQAVIGKKQSGNGGQMDLAETVMLDTPGRAAVSSLPRQLLLLVDGGGSYLLHNGQRASIGRAATDDPADVPIFSDLSSRHAEIARVEDDYFVMSPHDLEVGGMRTRQQLLKEGDRVVLARRAKFTMRMPNRMSPSARMDISESTKMPNDVRRVILFKETAMIGRGSKCHITCRSAQHDLVLFERGGQLWIRPQGRGLAGTSPVRIELGKPVEIEGAAFVVQPWAVCNPGSSRLI